MRAFHILIDQPGASAFMRICSIDGSSMIDSAAYDADAFILGIRFRDSGPHFYFDVPEAVFDCLCAAASAGTFFNERIRDRYRQGDWKLTDIGDGIWRLFDIARDPSETRDLSLAEPALRAALAAAWERYAGEVGVIAPTPSRTGRERRGEKNCAGGNQSRSRRVSLACLIERKSGIWFSSQDGT